ncbi:MAG: ACT domain-containing protein [Planctomycetia bacterium]
MKQITIVGADRPGMVAEVSAALAAAGVNIETLDGESLGATGVVLLTVDRYDAALRALADAGFTAVSEDALVVRLQDRPGELARITLRFKEAGVNLRSVRILHRADGWSLVAIAAERTAEAIDLVRDVLVS